MLENCCNSVGITKKNRLAIMGGVAEFDKSIAGDMFIWPIVTPEHENAVIEVLRARSMSSEDITRLFERKYADMLDMKYGLGFNNGTAAIHSALFGMGVGKGDEIIAPSMTYWASVVPAYSLGATVAFADIDPNSLCINAKDIEHRITNRTKAIIVVHFSGMPVDMDQIMEIARKHKIMVLEDCSHAHGALYKGRHVGTFGDASAFSLMSGKSLAIGEAGIMFTNNQRIYERALLFGHYSRHSDIELDDLKEYTGVPCGGYKYRMHQVSAAFGLVQLKYYHSQMTEIDKAMNYFCDIMEGTQGIVPIRPDKASGCTKGGWFFPLIHYKTEQLHGLSISRFAEAVQAEGVDCTPGCNLPLHLHPLFTKMDVYGDGKPTRLANSSWSLAGQIPERLPVSETINRCVFTIPWFKHYRPDIIRAYAEVYKKVVSNHEDLLAGDTKQDANLGGYSSSKRIKK